MMSTAPGVKYTAQSLLPPMKLDGTSIVRSAKSRSWAINKESNVQCTLKSSAFVRASMAYIVDDLKTLKDLTK